jgi:hypothetical protein
LGKEKEKKWKTEKKEGDYFIPSHTLCFMGASLYGFP